MRGRLRRARPLRDGTSGEDGDDLEVLDPSSGEALASARPVPVATTAAAAAAADRAPSGVVRRRRRASRLLAASAAACAIGAAWSGFTIATLRAVERPWAEAVALDVARENADRAAFSLAASVGGGGRDDDALRDALDRIGDEAAGELLVREAQLRARWIFDDRIDALRDEMLEAMRFRRFQLDPSRRDLGDTPLRRADTSLARELRRFRLEPWTASPPELSAAAPALASLRRYAAVETGTLLVVAGDRRLVTVDVDADTASARPVPPVVEVVATGGLAVVRTEDGVVTAYPPDGTAPPAWTMEGRKVVASRTPGVAAWVQASAGLVPVGTDDRARPPVPVPVGAEVLADTDGGLLLRSAGGAFELHDPVTGVRRRTLPLAGRFAGASPGVVAVWADGDRPALVLLRLPGDGITDVSLPRAGDGPVVHAPGDGAFAFAAAGASVLRVDGPTWSVVGIGGPRASAGPGGLTWSPDGRFLFWVTPDGRLAFGDEVDQAIVRAPIGDAAQVVALPRRR